METPRRLSAEAAEKMWAKFHAETASIRSESSPLYHIQSLETGFFAYLKSTVQALGSLIGIGESQPAIQLQDAATAQPFRGEAMEELLDALSPIYDQLQLAPSWWFLEWMPLRVKKDSAIYTSSDNHSDYKWL
jgi:hypothetical protein